MAARLQSLAIMITLVIASLFITTMATAQPPALGDWVVSGDETYVDETLYVNSSIYVDGNLILDNTVLVMNEQNTTITVNGTLELRNDSKITAPDTGYYFMMFNPGSKADFSDSIIENYGMAIENAGRQGIWLNQTESATFDNCMVQGAIFAKKTAFTFKDSELTPDNDKLDYVTGIYLLSCQDAIITGSKLYGNESYNTQFFAIFADDVTNFTVKDNDIFSHSGYGLIVSCNDSEISNNIITVNNTGTGISITGNRNVISSNEITLTGPAFSCIMITGANDILIHDNDIDAGLIGTGIELDSTDNVTIMDNTIEASNPANNVGLSLANSNGTQILGCTMERYYTNLYIYNSIFSTIENNTLNDGLYGMAIEDCSLNRIANNQISSSNESGLSMKRSSDNDIVNNAIWDNDWGFEAIETDEQTVNSIMENNTWQSGGVMNAQGKALIQDYVKFRILNYYDEGVFNANIQIDNFEYYTDLEGYTTATSGNNFFTLYTIDNVDVKTPKTYQVNVSWPRLPGVTNHEYTNATVDFNVGNPMEKVLYINSGPDIYIEDVALSDNEVTEGDTLTVTVTVHNKWAKSVNGLNILIQGTPFPLYGEGNITTLAANSSESIDIEITVRNTYGFGWADEELEIYIDPDGSIEPYIVNTTNNKMYVPLTILESDDGGEFPMWLLPFNLLLGIIIVMLLLSAAKEKKKAEEGSKESSKEGSKEDGEDTPTDTDDKKDDPPIAEGKPGIADDGAPRYASDETTAEGTESENADMDKNQGDDAVSDIGTEIKDDVQL
jgi:parallel beta-helix repeat protein